MRPDLKLLGLNLCNPCFTGYTVPFFFYKELGAMVTWVGRTGYRWLNSLNCCPKLTGFMASLAE